MNRFALEPSVNNCLVCCYGREDFILGSLYDLARSLIALVAESLIG